MRSGISTPSDRRRFVACEEAEIKLLAVFACNDSARSDAALRIMRGGVRLAWLTSTAARGMPEHAEQRPEAKKLSLEPRGKLARKCVAISSPGHHGISVSVFLSRRHDDDDDNRPDDYGNAGVIKPIRWAAICVYRRAPGALLCRQPA